MVDAQDLGSCKVIPCGGSSPLLGTKMDNFFTHVVLTSSIIISLVSVFLTANLQKDFNRIAPTTELSRGEVDLYLDGQGIPKYSLGACKGDDDCTPAGCSLEICSDDPNLVTACFFSDDYPDKTVYECGCIKNSCVWIKK